MSNQGPTHHFGRGGAGNTTAKDPSATSLPPAATPTLKSDHYTTGRGGTGNMAKNDLSRPEEARAAQDVDVPSVTVPEGPRSTGRGGAANIYQPTEDERAQAKAHNEETRRESFNKRTGLKGVLEKGKDIFKTKPKDETDNAAGSAVED